VKGRDVIKKIASEAERRGGEWRFCREGAYHCIYMLDGMVIRVPRHKEVGENLVMDIFKDSQDVLGKGWWRK